MARSPHSSAVVSDALDAAGIDGDWTYLSSRTSKFEARNGASFYFDKPDGIFFRGSKMAIKELVRAIWSYKVPKRPLMTKAYFRQLQAKFAQFRKRNM
jgi:hypothetical protein